jgi:hypothetical protein
VENTVIVSHDLRIIADLMALISKGDINMDTSFQLVGKTISGVVASPAKGNDPRRIWMLQFSDGTHVEFVSPSAKRRLNRVTGGHQRPLDNHSDVVKNLVNAA